MMTLRSTDGTALFEISALERRGSDLLIKGKVFGTMPVTTRLSPAETRNGLRLLGLRLILFILTLPFRRG